MGRPTGFWLVTGVTINRPALSDDFALQGFREHTQAHCN